MSHLVSSSRSHRIRVLRWVITPALVGAVACGGEESSDDDGSGPSPTSPTPGPQTTDTPSDGPEAGGPTPVDTSVPLFGSFQVSLVNANATTNTAAVASVQGAVYDAEQNELTIWTPVQTDAATGCKLSTPRTPSCQGGCGTGSACIEDGECRPYPTAKSLGAVTLTGLNTADGGSSFEIRPQQPRLNYIKPAAVALAFPPAAEGADVVLTSEGGDFDAVRAVAEGIAPLELLGPSIVPISSGTPMTLEWVAAQAGASEIEVDVDISHHGGAKGKITCKVPDTGSLTIPANLVTGLIDLGFSGFPAVALTRASVGGARIGDGRLELRIASAVSRPLEIPGLVSCLTDDECTEPGQVCRTDKACGPAE